MHDEGRIDEIGLSECLRRQLVKGIQHDSDDEEERELEENGNSAGQEREHGLALVARGQQPLDDELVGAVAGGRQECTPDYARPKGIGSPEVHTEIENSQLVGILGNAVN